MSFTIDQRMRAPASCSIHARTAACPTDGDRYGSSGIAHQHVSEGIRREERKSNKAYKTTRSLQSPHTRYFSAANFLPAEDEV